MHGGWSLWCHWLGSVPGTSIHLAEILRLTVIVLWVSEPREKLAKSESVRDNSGYPGRTDFRYLHWSALKVPKGCFMVRGSKNVFILTIWWLQVIILGRTVFYRCLPQGNSGLRSLLFQRGIIFVVLLNGVQSKITFVQHNWVNNWVRHPRSRVSLRLLLWTSQSQQRQSIRWTNQNFERLAREKTRASNLRLVGFLLVKSGGQSKQTWNFLLKQFWKKKVLKKRLVVCRVSAIIDWRPILIRFT